MSSTNRGNDRHASDLYRTPRWVLRRLLDADYTAQTVGLNPDGSLPTRWLEPAAGDGRIVRAVHDHGTKVDWTVVEIRPEERPGLLALQTCVPVEDVQTADTLVWADALARDDRAVRHWDVAITNPPFSIAMEMLLALLPLCRRVTFLQRRAWLGSEGRAEFFRTHMPDEGILPNRPCFTLNDAGKPTTDSADYSLFTFHGAPRAGDPVPLRTRGETLILGSTSKEERKIETDELIAEDRRLLPKKTPTPNPTDPSRTVHPDTAIQAELDRLDAKTPY